MSHIPFEYALVCAVGVSMAVAWVGTVLSLPYTADLMAISIPATYIAYSYSPLPQGPQTPGHRKRKRKWGFAVESEDGPQRTLSEYGENR